MTIVHSLAPLAMRLAGRISLSSADHAALLALPFQERSLPAGGYVLQEGDRATSCHILLSGLAHRHRFSTEGMRHIVGIHGPGDILNLPSLPPPAAEDFVQALTSVRIATVPIESILDLSRTCPAIASALWTEAEAELSIARAWVANMGRRDARGRIAHLFCELVIRNHPMGGFDGCVFSLPLTQSELADATGITTVHVNRTLRALESDGIIRRDRREIMVPQWQRLAQLVDFRPAAWAGRRSA
ncbi:Crp/Fnr family transcriptional regulator [Sphingobium sp. CCH11-B1]|jgi:CRP-like cAMP-binding protein|uniref:Crp/Fnr family transcriptional regulator n=1 Tax=Sphingobium sp. CCH11-B1 TaxID=1768781 RepID=UPI00082C0C2E|nr:Crp/Fnr family transcriptional regulator [Sphingobium sp. CCH11-B1]MEA3388420.1 Crp/Fnr family transcriptional regulator [Pseudomonadota bacterium]